MDKLYLLRHKPTGLYYRPKRHLQGHLTEKGKVYHNLPKLNNHYSEGHRLYLTKRLSEKYTIGIESVDEVLRFIPYHSDEWEVVEL